MSQHNGMDYIKNSQQQQQQQQKQKQKQHNNHNLSFFLARTACLSVTIKPARLSRLHRTELHCFHTTEIRIKASCVLTLRKLGRNVASSRQRSGRRRLCLARKNYHYTYTRFEGVLHKSQSVDVRLKPTEMRVENLKVFRLTFLLDMSEVRFVMEMHL
jgi:hypothetical protein